MNENVAQTNNYHILSNIIGLVPSVWKERLESLVVPVPKKSLMGICETTNFQGTALTSTVSKVMCTVLNNRLSCVAEDEGLIAEEQVGFRKHRGCRDQVLALVLLIQMEVAKKAKGMMVTFIDFSKAYDRVDREQLWRCLEGLGIEIIGNEITGNRIQNNAQSAVLVVAVTGCWTESLENASFLAEHRLRCRLRTRGDNFNHI